MKKFVCGMVALVAAGTTIACSSVEKQVDQTASAPSAETVTAAREVAASHVVEVNFDKNSFVLTEGSRAALSQLVQQAKSTGKIDDVEVLAWADVAYPANSNQKTTKAERDLADKRAQAITNYLKAELAVSDVDTHNMAVRPNSFQEWFNTSDARLKSALENAGVTSNQGKSLTGKASRAVVMVMLEK